MNQVLNHLKIYNDSLPTLVARLRVFARKALRARQQLINCFKNYLNSDHQDAAEVIKEQVRIMTEYGVPADDIARMLVTFNVVLLSNTGPTVFWTLFNIFSQPKLLKELRTELEEVAISRKGVNFEFELDLVAIKTKCPILLSIFEQTQRTRTIHAYIRKGLEDTTLDIYCLR
jgi:hypothetical protein